MTKKRPSVVSKPRLNPPGGFTLVELVVTIVVLAILVVMAAPSFTEMNARQRVQTAASDLFTSLLRARSEAIRGNTDAMIVPTGTWAGGWTIQVKGVTVDQHAATNNISIAGNVVTVTYGSSGRVSGATPPQFTLSASDTSLKRCVQVRLSGEPVVTGPACS